MLCGDNIHQKYLRSSTCQTDDLKHNVKYIYNVFIQTATICPHFKKEFKN
jgi:hypothetical protein